jgi:hypothetical protein
LVSVSVVVAGMIMASMASPPVWAVLLKAADWRMNERSGKMLDSSRHSSRGTPRHVVRTGSTYVFNGSTSYVAVPDHASLDPASEGISLTASVRVPNRAMDDDSYDIVRKGLAGRPGGQYKMEIKRAAADPTVGKLNCLFQGTGGTVNKVSRRDIVDGEWHTLECTKRTNVVVARVDGRTYTRRGSAGTISNRREVLVGAKTTRPLDDMFRGSMNFVRIHIAR